MGADEEGENVMYKKLMLSVLVIAIGFIFNNLNVLAYEEEKLNDYNSQNILSVNKNNNTMVYYRNASDNNTLWEYNVKTRVSTKITSYAVRDIRILERNNGDYEVFFMRPNSTPIYFYDPKTKVINERTTAWAGSSFDAIDTGEIFRIYKQTGSSQQALQIYDVYENRSYSLGGFSNHYALTTILRDDRIFVFSRTGINATPLRVVEDVGTNNGTSVNVFSQTTTEYKILNTTNHYKILFRNNSDGNKLYEYDMITKQMKKLTDAAISNISVLELQDHNYEVYFSNTEDGGKLYVYKSESDEIKKISERAARSIEATYTNEGLRVFFSNDDDLSKMYNLFVYDGEKEIIEEVSDVFANVLHDSIYLTWKNPDLEDLRKVIIYQDGVKVGETIVPKNEYQIKGLAPETEYEIVLTTLYGSGTESSGVRLLLNTLKIQAADLQVTNLKAEPKHDRVNLSWQNPDIQYFDYVRIYRKEELEEKTSFFNYLMGSKAFAYTEEYDPIFETNGTRFNDLTVKSDTKYEYLLNSVTIEGVELGGVSIQVVTSEEPAPTMGGVNETTNEFGDYVYRWSSPTTGTVKIFVGGDEYSTVVASVGQITIPKDDMKYTVFGNPDVRLQPISESGIEGKQTSPGIGGSVGLWDNILNANDFLKATMNFIMLVGPFVLLAIAVRFAPRIIKLIKQSLGNRRFKT